MDLFFKHFFYHFRVAVLLFPKDTLICLSSPLTGFASMEATLSTGWKCARPVRSTRRKKSERSARKSVRTQGGRGGFLFVCILDPLLEFIVT